MVSPFSSSSCSATQLGRVVDEVVDQPLIQTSFHERQGPLKCVSLKHVIVDQLGRDGAMLGRGEMAC